MKARHIALLLILAVVTIIVVVKGCGQDATPDHTIEKAE